MKKALLTIAAVVLLASFAAAQATVTCSLSGLTAKQQQLIADFLANLNAGRAAQQPPLPPFADFNAFCGDTMKTAVIGYAQTQRNVEVAKVTAAALVHGDETATNPQCTAAGLANGCKKEQVACFVLSGNAACN